MPVVAFKVSAEFVDIGAVAYVAGCGLYRKGNGLSDHTGCAG